MPTRAMPRGPALGSTMTHRQRLRRDDWIQAALDNLAAGGGAFLSISALARDLGVTEGSFYHHFSGRADLIRALAGRLAGPDAADLLQADLAGIQGPLDQLRRIHAVWQRDAARDQALRRLAEHDPEIAGAVCRADAAAATAMTRAFAGLGFTPSGAALRAKLLLRLSRGHVAGNVTAAGPGEFERALTILAGRQDLPFASADTSQATADAGRP